MKKQIFGISSAALLMLGLFSCKEQPVGVDYSNIKKTDTTYMASVEAPQTKNFYIEEFTGVRCVNCPQGAAKLDEMMTANPDRLKIVAIHAMSFAAPNYTKGSVQDLRSTAGAEITSLIYGGDPAKPNASFDRLNLTTGSNPMLGPYGGWAGQLEKAKAENPSTPVNIYVTSTYNSSAEAYDIKVKLAYNSDLADAHALSIYLVEDNIIDKQVEPEIDNFKFKHVLRQALTPVNGVSVLDSIEVKKAGLVFETTYQLKIDMTDETENKQKFWNLDNIHIIAFVHKPTGGTDKKVYQAVDAALK